MTNISDEEMLKCLTKLVGSTCKIYDSFNCGCLSCPSQRKDEPGCVLRMFKNKLKRKIVADIRRDIIQNEGDINRMKDDIGFLVKRNEGYEKKIKEIEEA